MISYQNKLVYQQVEADCYTLKSPNAESRAGVSARTPLLISDLQMTTQYIEICGAAVTAVVFVSSLECLTAA